MNYYKDLTALKVVSWNTCSSSSKGCSLLLIGLKAPSGQQDKTINFLLPIAVSLHRPQVLFLALSKLLALLHFLCISSDRTCRRCRAMQVNLRYRNKMLGGTRRMSCSWQQQQCQRRLVFQSAVLLLRCRQRKPHTYTHIQIRIWKQGEMGTSVWYLHHSRLSRQKIHKLTNVGMWVSRSKCLRGYRKKEQSKKLRRTSKAVLLLFGVSTKHKRISAKNCVFIRSKCLLYQPAGSKVNFRVDQVD